MDQAKLETYANWLVQNKTKKGTPEFDTVAKAYKEGRSMMSGAPAQPTGTGQSIDQVISDPKWVQNAKTLYKDVEGKDFSGPDTDAGKWLKDYIYDFNYRLTGSEAAGLRNTIGIGMDLKDYSPEGKQAFLDAQDTFDNLDYSMSGVGEAAKRVVTDPLNIVGVTGIGSVLKFGAKEAAKQGVEELAKVGVKQGFKKGAALGAIEGGTFAGASDLATQNAMVNAGGQASIDPLQTIQNTTIGTGVGFGLGGALGGIAGGIAGRNPTVRAAKQIVADPEVAARGAEITMRMADLQDSVKQLSPDTFVGKEQVNANLAPIKGDVKAAIDQLGLDKNTARKLKEGLDKASGISENDIAKLRATPEGSAVAENIMFLRQANAMTRPIPNDGFIPKVGRFAMDKISPIPAITDPLKSALFPARISGELRVANLAADRKIAEEILRLKGPSKATAGRQWLLDQGLKMAKARQELRAQQAALNAKSKADFELRREARKAEVAKRRADAEQARLKKAEEAQASREARQRQKELNDLVRTRTGLGKQQARETDQSFRQNVRTNTGLGRQQNAEIAKQERSAVKGFEEALSKVNAKMAMDQRLNRQRLSELATADKALAEVQASVSAAKAKEGQAFSQALRKTTAKMKSLAALEKFKQRELVREAKANEAGEVFKPARSRKFTKATENTKSTGEQAGRAEAPRQSPPQGAGVYNPIAYQAGADTIVDFQRRALDAAERQSDKKLSQLLKRAVEDMVLAKNNQQKRQEAYDKAADAAAEISAEALEFIDENLYFLVMKYANQ